MVPALLLTLSVAPVVLPGCSASKSEVGSIHAATSFDVQLTKPISKLKQPLDCGGKTVTLYWQELASTEQLGFALNFMGPTLWGDAEGPSDEHSDELMSKGSTLVVASGPAAAVAAAKLSALGFKAWRPPPAEDVIDRMAAELDCSSGKDPLREWCPAVDTRNAGYSSPKGKGVYVGLSVPMASDLDLRRVLLATTRVSVLAFDGEFLWLSDMRPENEDEQRQVAEVAASIALVLKADAKKVVVPKGVADYLATLPARTRAMGAAVKDQAIGPAHFKSSFPGRAWKVKSHGLDVYVVTEEAGDGSWLSVYPVVPIRAK